MSTSSLRKLGRLQVTVTFSELCRCASGAEEGWEASQRSSFQFRGEWISQHLYLISVQVRVCWEPLGGVLIWSLVNKGLWGEEPSRFLSVHLALGLSRSINRSFLNFKHEAEMHYKIFV